MCEAPIGPVCSACRRALRPPGPMVVDGVDVVRAGFALDERSRPIIAALKYRRQRRLARWLAAPIAELVPVLADAITWIPATPEHRRSRGFDQAEEIARVLSKMTGVPARRLLVRGRTDERQTGQTRLQRRRGPTLRAAARSSEFVIMVDDVVTTGSSMRVAAGVVRAAGARRVIGLAVAATPLREDVVSLI